MTGKKEIVVLSGAGHKGIVKMQSATGAGNLVKGTCNLDFRPHGASLYLVGDDIAQIRLNDTNTAFEVQFQANDDFGCVVRSSSITMFGGNIPNGKILKRIDEYNKQKAVRESVESCSCKAEEIECAQKETAHAEQKTKIDTTLGEKLDEWTKYDGNNFYYAVKPQIDELFVCFPEEKSLCEAVANSKWVHVQTDEDYYVVGVLYNDEEPSFICYGVPAAAKQTPPAELENACVWLPVGSDGSGYWVIYQSARTGEIVK